jgi:exodeoxyribonuclease III
MRIVVWNCNMAFHRKYDNLLALQPDIAVISECANIELIAKKAPGFNPSSSIWIGENRQKGIGIFTFGAFKGRQRPIYEDQFPYFVPIKIDGPQQFNLLAVWACHKTRNSYVAGFGPLKRAIRQYRGFIEEGPTAVAGDFNDNVLWDKPNKTNSFRGSVSELADLGLQSAYHISRGVEHGNELEPTI